MPTLRRCRSWTLAGPDGEIKKYVYNGLFVFVIIVEFTESLNVHQIEFPHVQHVAGKELFYLSVKGVRILLL